MEKKEYLSEERYQKNKKRIVAGAIVVLIIGLLLGGSLIAIGLSKQNKVNANYSEANKESLAKKLEIEKQSLISSKEKIEEEIKPVEDEIKSLEREKFTGFDDAYYQRQDKIEELEKSINESKKNISAIETALGDSMSACSFDTTTNNSYTKEYCSIKNSLEDASSSFNKKFDSHNNIPYYMFGGFIIAASLMISVSIYTFAKRREILAFSAQQVMPVAKEGIEKMTPTVSKSVEEITRSVKKGLKDDK